MFGCVNKSADEAAPSKSTEGRHATCRRRFNLRPSSARDRTHSRGMLSPQLRARRSPAQGRGDWIQAIYRLFGGKNRNEDMYS